MSEKPRAEHLGKLQLRPAGQVIGLSVLFLVLFVVGALLQTWSEIFWRTCYDVARIEIQGLTEEELGQTRICFTPPIAVSFQMPARLKGKPEWVIRDFGFGKLHLEMSTAALDKVARLTFSQADKRVEYSGESIRKTWSHVEVWKDRGDFAEGRVAVEFLLPDHSDAETILKSDICVRSATRNVTGALIGFFVVGVLFLLFRLFIRDQRIARITEGLLLLSVRPRGKLLEQRAWLWMSAGLAIVVCSLAALEYRQPFYFAQDDTFAQFLPVMLLNCGALEQGQFPVWNPYQFLGAPTTTLGVYATTYPGTFLSYLLAKYVLGNANLMIEVFAFAHLVLGYAVTFLLLRSCRVRPLLAMTGAVFFILSGFSLIAGRSWYYMLPVAVWLPALVLCLQMSTSGKPGLRLIVLTGILLGVFFHAGNAQMWIYTVLLCAIFLGVAILAGATTVSRCKWTVPAFLIGFGIAAPLFLVQLAETQHVDRFNAAGRFAGISWLHVFLPWRSLHHGFERATEIPNLPRIQEICHFGTLFSITDVLAVLAVLAVAFSYRGAFPWLKRCLHQNPWLVPMIVAFLFAMGNRGILWNIFALLPGFNKFNQSIKFFEFVVLFGIMTAALIFERWLVLSRPKAKPIAIGIAALCAINLVFHLAKCNHSFFDYADKPYPALNTDLSRLLSGQTGLGRVFVVAPERSVNPGFTQTLALDFPTVYNIVADCGYDYLVLSSDLYKKVKAALQDNPKQAAAAYGFGWAVKTWVGEQDVYEQPTWDFVDANLWKLKVWKQLGLEGKQANQLGDSQLYRLESSDPLAFVTGSSGKALAVSVSTKGFTVDAGTVPVGNSVTTCFLWRPWFKAYLDGQELKPTSDNWGRLVVSLPKAGSTLSFIYSPPWLQGLLASVVLLIAAGGIYLFFEKKSGKSG